MLKDTLLLADAGYFALDYFEQVSQDGCYFLVRAKKNGPEYRLIYLPDEKRPVFLVTNLKEHTV